MKHREKARRSILTLLLSTFIFSALLYGKMSVYATSVMVQKTIYHEHTGDEINGGGCYKNIDCTATATVTESNQGIGACVYGCSKPVPTTTWKYYYTHNECELGKTPGQSLTKNECDHDSSKTAPKTFTHSMIKLACGKNDQTIEAKFTLQPNTTNWTKEVVIQALVDQLSEESAIIPNRYIWNGSEATSQNEYIATSNGVFQCRLVANNSIAEETLTLSLPIYNIDNMPPTIKGIDYEKGRFVKLLDLSVNSIDYQPDGTIGCGLDEKAYSYDGGNTWSDNAHTTIRQNGDYSLAVRDKLGNIVTKHVIITNIDISPPTVISCVESPIDHQKKTMQVLIRAEDYQPDGSKGVGLAKKPYSYTGGETWVEESSVTISQNGMIPIYIKDALDNTMKHELVITQIPEDKEEEIPTDTVEEGDNKEPEESTEESEKKESEESTEESVKKESEESIEESEKNDLTNSKEVKPIETVVEIQEEEASSSLSPKKRSPKKVVEQEEIPLSVNMVKQQENTVTVPKRKQKDVTRYPEKIENKNHRIQACIIQSVTISSVILASVGFLLFLLYLWSHFVIVRGLEPNNTYRTLGIVLLKKEEQFIIRIGKQIEEHASSTVFDLQVNSYMANKYQEEPVMIYGCGQVKETTIKRHIEASFE